MLQPLLTTQEVANHLRIPQAAVVELVETGELVAYRVYGDYRFAPATIESFLAANATGPIPLMVDGGRRETSRYRAIADLLDQAARNENSGRIEFAFNSLDAVLRKAGEEPLPPSAREHRAWWANTRTHSQAASWMNRGWRVGKVDFDKELVGFVRVLPEGFSKSTPLPDGTSMETVQDGYGAMTKHMRRTDGWNSEAVSIREIVPASINDPELLTQLHEAAVADHLQQTK